MQYTQESRKDRVAVEWLFMQIMQDKLAPAVAAQTDNAAPFPTKWTERSTAEYRRVQFTDMSDV